jgi:2'-5' RNA ligase
MNPVESALVVTVPEAEPLVERFRSQHGLPAAPGLPAHVTVLYPFKPPQELTTGVVRRLRELFLTLPAFTTSFREARQFPGVLYLAPEPAEPFRRLTEALAECFPETPPYGGEFTEIVPHLTVAHDSDPQRFLELTAAFERAAQDALPIRVRVTEVTLLDNERGDWQVRDRFALGADTDALRGA